MQAVVDFVKPKVRPADVITVDAPGFQGDQVDGFKDIVLKLIDYYAHKVEIKKNSVNVIGVIPGFDYRWRYDVLSLINSLAIAGLEVNTVLGGWNNIEQLKQVGSAALNIVLSEIRGIEIAQHLQELFQTPYVSPRYLPIGKQNISDWFREISAYLKIDTDNICSHIEDQVKSFEYAQLGFITNFMVNTNVAIVSEPYRAMALARFLVQDIGLKLAAICVTESNNDTEKLLNKTLAEVGQPECQVLLTSNADDLHGVLRKAKVKIIYGSSFEGFIARQTGASLIKINYPVYDQVLMTERPYLGIRGICVLMEDLINAIINNNLQ
jgi:nitrogenase molybdenum-iron protein beta chain